MSPELLRCPFCGGEPYLHQPDFPGDHYQVGCYCGAPEDSDEAGGVWKDGTTFEEVAARWNRRATGEIGHVAVYESETDLDLEHDELLTREFAEKLVASEPGWYVCALVPLSHIGEAP